MTKPMNAQEKMTDLEGVIVTIDGTEYDLGQLTYNEFSELLDALTEEEVEHVLTTVVEALGEDEFLSFLAKLQILADLDEETEDEEPTTTKKETRTKAPVLEPVRFVDMNDFYSYDPDLVVEGIDSVSVKVGQYLAYVNAGLLNEQAFELITIEEQRQHELAIAKLQLELERMKLDAQVRAKGVTQLIGR